MKYTFQHYIDIQTSASSLTLFQVQAGGHYALMRIKHLLGAYKYIKLGRVSIKLLPASTLPVDPLGLSYDSSDPQTIDPRDQMNPGLVRITNGEDINTDFTGLSDEAMEQMYINTMLDPRWSKFMLQSGFKRSAVPLYWNVGQLAQDPYPGAVTNIPRIVQNATTSVGLYSTSSEQHFDIGSSDASALNYYPANYDRDFSDPRGFFQTGHRGRMGWMPTDAFYHIKIDTPSSGSSPMAGDTHTAMYHPLPEINVITVLLPKAHKTVYYYRCFITETVYLSGLKNTGINTEGGIEYRAIDNFTTASWPSAYPPTFPVSMVQNYPRPRPMNDGGGDQ